MPIPNLSGGRFRGQGNMFADHLIKLNYGPDKEIPLSVSFTYNAPIFSLKVKVRSPGCSNTRDNGDTSPGTLLSTAQDLRKLVQKMI